jgi:signal transduction histidine kinase
MHVLDYGCGHQQLRNALFELASHDTDKVEELPEAQPAEFGEVITGFNQTLRRLNAIIDRTRRTEAEARAGAIRTEEAYAKLQNAQESLVQAEKMASLGGLVAGIAHEINTPVGITLTSASILHEETEQMSQAIALGGLKKTAFMDYVATASESSQLILKNAQRAAQLIQSFKQVAVDQTSEQRREYDLGAYIRAVIASLHPLLTSAQVVVAIDCPDLIKLDSYPGAVAQVITNLTTNALTHAFQECGAGKIGIAATERNRWVELRFSDNGCGILPAHIGKIFDPFFTTRRGAGGTGLGLNIVFNILSNRLGGVVSVQSEIGQGSCFILRFPCVSPKAEIGCLDGVPA